MTGSAMRAWPGRSSTPSSSWTSRNLSDLLGRSSATTSSATSRRPARGGDAAAAVDLTLVEAAFGVTREVEVDIVAACDRCEGAGPSRGRRPQTCPSCGGSGHVQHVSNTAFGQFVQTAACAACRGRGRADRHALHRLPRARPAPVAESVEVQIPAGIMSGQRLRMAGHGHAGESGAARGDLYVNVAVAPTTRFEREGNDIVSVLDVPFTRAAIGTTTTIETLDGRHELEVRPGTQPGEVLLLRGKGIPVLGGRGRGDHRVVVNVLVPRKLSDEQRSLLDRFEATVDDAHVRRRRRVLPQAADRVSVRRYRLRVPAAEAEPAPRADARSLPRRGRGGARRRRRRLGRLRGATPRPTASSRTTVEPGWEDRWRAYHRPVDRGPDLGRPAVVAAAGARPDAEARPLPSSSTPAGRSARAGTARRGRRSSCCSGSSRSRRSTSAAARACSRSPRRSSGSARCGASTSIRSRSARPPRTRRETASRSRGAGRRAGRPAAAGAALDREPRARAAAAACSSGPTCPRGSSSRACSGARRSAGASASCADGWAAELVRP